MSTLVSNRRSRPHADTDPATNWAEHGLCVRKARDFHASEVKALVICEACPVRLRCLSEALREEGLAAPSYRSEIRGGLTAFERAVLSGWKRPTAPTGGRASGDMDKAEELLRTGTLTDLEVADATGVSRQTVGKLRRALGLSSPVDLRGATPQERIAQRTRPGQDGHLLWVGTENTHVSGRTVKGIRLAFEVGHGRPPEIRQADLQRRTVRGLAAPRRPAHARRPGRGGSLPRFRQGLRALRGTPLPAQLPPLSRPRRRRHARLHRHSSQPRHPRHKPAPHLVHLHRRPPRRGQPRRPHRPSRSPHHRTRKPEP